MKRERPCRSCVHFEWCRGKELCNSYISKSELNDERLDKQRSDMEYLEYWDAYNDYADEFRD